MTYTPAWASGWPAGWLPFAGELKARCGCGFSPPRKSPQDRLEAGRLRQWRGCKPCGLYVVSTEVAASGCPAQPHGRAASLEVMCGARPPMAPTPHHHDANLDAARVAAAAGSRSARRSTPPQPVGSFGADRGQAFIVIARHVRLPNRRVSTPPCTPRRDRRHRPGHRPATAVKPKVRYRCIAPPCTTYPAPGCVEDAVRDGLLEHTRLIPPALEQRAPVGEEFRRHCLRPSRHDCSRLGGRSSADAPRSTNGSFNSRERSVWRWVSARPQPAAWNGAA